MLEVLSFLLSLLATLSTAINRINLADERRLARKIIETHRALQAILEDARRIFDLLEDVGSQLEEYGEEKFTKILKDNFEDQLWRIERLVSIL